MGRFDNIILRFWEGKPYHVTKHYKNATYQSVFLKQKPLKPREPTGANYGREKPYIVPKLYLRQTYRRIIHATS